MAITRRGFLKQAGLATVGSFLGPGFLHHPLIHAALADSIGDKFFVVVNLSGGNDGLNTVVPYDDGRVGSFRRYYEEQRTASSSGGLRILQNEIGNMLIGTDAATATPLALHPALTGFKNVYDLGKVAIVQGCGYPQPSLSHSDSSRKMETADPLGTGYGTGWMGRYLAARYAPTDVPAISTRDAVPGEFIQYTTGVLAAASLADFTLPFDTYDASDNAAKAAAYDALYGAARSSTLPVRQYIGNVGGAMLTATQLYPALHDLYVADRSSWNRTYDTAGVTAANFREIAKAIYGVINGRVSSRFFELFGGGYDTHSDQGGATGAHALLLNDFGNGLEVFYNDCADMGVADKLCILVWSEFGRRVRQNDNGSDHGTQAPMFVIGGTVQGGIYGNHPNIAPEALDPTVPNTLYSQAIGDPHRSTDFRDVYGTLLKHWLGLSEVAALGILPIDHGDPKLYWTTPDFDLPFLPA